MQTNNVLDKLTDDDAMFYALSTLTEIWSCIDWDKVDQRRAMGIWQEYASKVKSCSSTTNSYNKFVEKLCKKLDVRVLKYQTISKVGKMPKESQNLIMKKFRFETQMLILDMKLNNQIRKEQQQKEKGE